MSIEQTLAYIDSLCESDPALSEALYTVLTERRNRKKAADAGSPQDSDRSASATGNRASYMGTAAEALRTFGGLTAPSDDAERMATLSAENYYDTTGGLRTPDYNPTVKAKLLAEFLRPKTAKRRTITEEQRAYRATSGGLMAPEV